MHSRLPRIENHQRHAALAKIYPKHENSQKMTSRYQLNFDGQIFFVEAESEKDAWGKLLDDMGLEEFKDRLKLGKQAIAQLLMGVDLVSCKAKLSSMEASGETSTAECEKYEKDLDEDFQYYKPNC